MNVLAWIPPGIKKRESVFLLSLIVVLGFGLRIYGLEFPCFWYDELATHYRVDGDLSHTFNTLEQSPFPPLYYILMSIWGRIFGLSESALRFPSMLFSTISIIAIYYLARTMFGEKEGLISALLLSVSSYALNYSHEAKMYAMIWFFMILSMIYFFLYIKTLQKKHLVHYCIYSIVTIYTLYLGFIFLLAHNILFFWFCRKRVKIWVVANTFILLAYIPWWSLAITNMSNKTGIGWITETGYGEFFKKLFDTISGIRIGDMFYGEFWVLFFLMVFAVVFSIYAVIKKKPCHRNHNYAILLSWPVLSLIFFIIIDQTITPILTIRYLGFLHIPLILLFAVGITAFDHLRLRWTGNLLLIVIVTTALYFHVLPFHQSGLKVHREYWSELILQICRQADNNSIILTNRGQRALKYYGKCFSGDVVTMSISKITETFIKEKLMHKKNYRTIFILYRGDKYHNDSWKSKWFMDHQGTIIKKDGLGLIRLDFNHQ